jgi:hypothetical protein
MLSILEKYMKEKREKSGSVMGYIFTIEYDETILHRSVFIKI